MIKGKSYFDGRGGFDWGWGSLFLVIDFMPVVS